jgi:hypothetical protein
VLGCFLSVVSAFLDSSYLEVEGVSNLNAPKGSLTDLS